MFTFLVNANNQLNIQKINTTDLTTATYNAGGTLKNTSEAAGQTSTEWRWYCVTWDINAGTGGEMKYYVNNVQVGTTQTPLGIWTGNLASAGRVLGATNNVGGGGWLGFLSEAVLFNRAIPSADRAVLYGV
jgi:hypothetical protein